MQPATKRSPVALDLAVGDVLPDKILDATGQTELESGAKDFQAKSVGSKRLSVGENQCFT